MCVLLAAVLSLVLFGTVAFAASEGPADDPQESVPAASAEGQETSLPAAASSDEDEHDNVPSGTASGMEAPKASRPGGSLPEGAAAYAVGSDLPEGAAAYGIGSDLPDGAAPYESGPTTQQAESGLKWTIVGEGTLGVVDGDETVEIGEWAEDAELPAEDVEFAAVPDDVKDEVTGVTVDGKDVDFEEDDAVWTFTVEEVTEDTEIVVSFGTDIPGQITVYGPGKVSVLEDDAWQPVSEEEPEFDGAIGDVMRFLATSTQTGYAASYISIGDKVVEPIMYSKDGPVFEVTVEAPLMDIGVRFLETDELNVVIEGSGSLLMKQGTAWSEVENGAKIPFDPDGYSSSDPMVFRAAPAAGYQMSDVRYASYPLILTKEEDPENSDSPAYTFSVPDPSGGAQLHVMFLASSDSTIQWLRGSSTTTGISWAVPLGTSVYGVSNVTDGSNVVTTQLTSGPAYEQARTFAARFGSVFTAWDFTLFNAQGASYTPTVPVLFSVPLPSGYPANTQNLRMLHIMADGQMTENPIELRTDAATGMKYIHMRAESLSTFILVNTASGTAVPTAVPTSVSGMLSTPVPTAPATASTPVPTAPGTADSRDAGLWWVLVAVCAAGMAAAVSVRRRRSAGGR